MVTEASVRSAICSAIEVEKGDAPGRFRVALPYDISGGDLCQVQIEYAEDGVRITDSGFTLQKASEFGDRVRRQAFQDQLAAILEVHGLVEQDGELQAVVKDDAYLGETLFEIGQVFATIIDLCNTRKFTRGTQPNKKARTELLEKVRKRLVESGLIERPLFRISETVQVKFHGVSLPIQFDYGYGTPKFPETIFQRVLADSEQSVADTLLRFEKAHHRKHLRRIALVGRGTAEPAAEGDWQFDQGVSVLEAYGEVIDVNEDSAVQKLRASVPPI